MSRTHSGSCLCGEVRFEIEGTFEHFYLCHCKHCRKDTGSAHAANLFSSTAHLSWVSGEKHVRLFNLPSTRHGKCFCGLCGSALPFTQQAGELLIVPAGSLDGDIELTPSAHIFCSSKANWDTGLDTLPGFDTFPG